MNGRLVIDAAVLPKGEVDHRSLIWWDNLLLLFVETTVFGLLVASYFYYSQNFTGFPPPRVHDPPIIYNPVPDLDAPSINMMLLLLSCVPMFFADRLCLRKDPNEKLVSICLIAIVLMGFVIAGMRFAEFSAVHFKWNENAYASIVWLILGTHLVHVVTGTLELLLMLVWTATHQLDTKHARDIRVTAVYWYWVAGIYIPLYILVFWSPRWL
jgi:heme/copper-type cytochrome/quinol oxidase subunit 3